MRVILSGGGTGGPVTPLLAVAEVLREKDPQLELLWLGTDQGPERQLVESENIIFKSIAAGKLRRYFSWQNFVDPFRVIKGFFQSLKIIDRFKPAVILSAGGFVSVPVIWAGWLKRVPSLVHQQDYQPVLAVKLILPFVKRVTVGLEETKKFFPSRKVVWTGHPIRRFLLEASREEAIKFFNLDLNLPTVLVTGGGTGALGLNLLVSQSLPELLKFYQVIHLTGEGKSEPAALPVELKMYYHRYDFLNKEMGLALAAADLVVSRAGASSTFEIASLAKPAILIPLPNSPQEKNAKVYADKQAALVISQSELSSEKLTSSIKQLIDNIDRRNQLAANVKKINPPGAAEKIAEEIWKIKK